MNTGYQTASLGNLFGLPYVVMRKPAPIDTTTLNYNWQIWETNAFSIYTKETDEVDEQSAQEAVAAVLRYLSRGYLYIFGGALMAGGGLAVLIEFLLNITFQVHRTFIWSFYPLAAGVLLGIMLLIIAVCKPLRRSLHRKFFI